MSSPQQGRGSHGEDSERLRSALPRDWQTIADAVADAVWLLDRDWRILQCNKASGSFFKQNSGEIIGRHCWELTHGSSRPPEGYPFARLQHGLRRESAELLLGDRWCEVTVDPILDDGGALVGGVHVTRDITERKRAEEELRASEGRFRAIAEYTYDWESWIGMDGRLLWVNPAVERITGYTVAECLAMPDYPLPLVHEEDRDAMTAAFRQAVQGVSYNDLRFRIQRKDGTDAWGAVSCQPIRNEEGVCMGHRASVRDVGERKRIENALRESEARFSTVFHASPVAIAITRLSDKQFVNVNETWQYVTGITQEEAIGRTSIELGCWVNPGARERLLSELLAKRTVRSLEMQMRHSSGAVHDMLMSAELIEVSGERGVLTLAQDITQLKHAEEALRESEQRFRLAMEAADEGLWDRHIPTDRVYRSPHFWSLLGYAPREIPNSLKGWLSLIHSDDREATLSRINMVLQPGADNFEAEYRLRTKDGKWWWIRSRGKVVERDAGGRVVRTMGTHVDITERKWTEYQREATLTILRLLNSPDSLHELMREVTIFLSSWSGCDAVGIRLREGEDFPYYETRGFTREFILAENRLCAVDREGMVVRDSRGNAVLECMCGNILCGRFDPSKPFFTEHGSFWTNCTTRLLATTTEADRQARTRNRCNGEGYESVALIPLRCEGQTLGLLQLNDKRQGRFTPELISFLEAVGDNLAIGLAQRQSVVALAESAQFNRATLDGLSAHIAIVNQAGVIEAVNKAWRDFAAANGPLTGNACEGAAYLDICERAAGECSEGAGEFARGVREVLTGRQDYLEMEYACHSPDVQRWFVVRVTRFPGEGPPRVVIAHENITERKQAEAEAQARRAELAHISRLNVMGELASGLAHELNQPLTTILTGTEVLTHLIQSETRDSGELAARLAEIGGEAERAGQIIHRLRKFVSKREIQCSTADVNAIIHEAVALMNPDARNHRVTLRLCLAESMPLIQADCIQLEQVVLNLLRNAIEAMNTSEADQRRVTIESHVCLSDTDNAIEVAIQDTGPGLPPGTLDRLFEPFYTTKSDGMGIGLAISRSIIEAHGGRLWAEANRDRGMTFRFRLPVKSGTYHGEHEDLRTDCVRSG